MKLKGGQQKMKANKLLPVFALLIVTGLIGTTLVAAYGWDKIAPNEDREAIQNAIENNDYDSWKTLMTAQISEERFDEMVAMHEEMNSRREAIESAIEAEDYDAWAEAVSQNGNRQGMFSQITEENFATFIELHKAQQAGDFDQVKSLSEELGFEPMRGKPHNGEMKPAEFGDEAGACGCGGKGPNGFFENAPTTE